MLVRLDSPKLQRAKGRAEVGFVQKQGETRLQHLHQSGCMKAMLPTTLNGEPEAVFVNTAGGVAGGDHLSIDVQCHQNTRATMTTQTAERIYRSTGATGQIDVHLRVNQGATACWLPQETIVFDGARLKRNLRAELGADSQLLLLESFMLGRKAMGESVEDCAISDHWNIRREGRLIFAEAMRINDAFALKGPAGLQDNLAFATFLWAAPGAHLHLERLRALLEKTVVQCAASAWEGVLIARFVAKDAYALRNALVPIIEKFRNTAMPRVWQL